MSEAIWCAFGVGGGLVIGVPVGIYIMDRILLAVMRPFK